MYLVHAVSPCPRSDVLRKKKKGKKKLLTLCMWTRLHRGGAEAFDSNAHARTALIISQCLHWKRNPRVLWCFFFAQVISCLRAALLRILWYITDMAAVCLCALHYFLPEKCIEISEMHPYRHLHRLWNTCGRQCSYFLSRHGCLTSPALPSRWVFSSVWPRGHSGWCCWVCYLLHLNSQHALLYETGWDASRQEVVEKLV